MSLPNFQEEAPLNNDQINVLRSAIFQHNPMAPPSLALLPSLNVYQEEEGYNSAMEAEGDEVYHLAASRARYAFYYCRVNGIVYQVITNVQVDVVYRVIRA